VSNENPPDEDWGPSSPWQRQEPNPRPPGQPPPSGPAPRPPGQPYPYGPAPGAPDQPGQQPYNPWPPYGPAGGMPGGQQVKIPNHMIWAVLTTLGCFSIPASIVAIVYAAQVGTRLQVGDIAGARRASGTARAWCIVATLLLAVFWLIALIGSVSDT
jgi:hypothetical protein